MFYPMGSFCKIMKQKSKLEKSRFILSIITPSTMLLHLLFIFLMVSFLEVLLFVGVFYIPIIILYFISVLIPFSIFSRFKKTRKLIIAISIVVVMAGSLALLFFAAGGTFIANAVIHSSPTILLSIGNFDAFVISSFCIVTTLVLSLIILSLISMLAKPNLI